MPKHGEHGNDTNYRSGDEYLVEFLGEHYPVTVQTNDATPVFDPENARIRATGEVAVPA